MSTGNLTTIDFKKRYKDIVVPAMLKTFKYSNRMQVPKLEKIVINCGIGSLAGSDKKKMEGIMKDFVLICGQKPVFVKIKKSIAGFGIREGAVVGIKTTLRKDKMQNFFNKLCMICLPRVRDFRGIDRKSFDDNGNVQIGIREHVIFPEIKPEESVVNFGLQISLTTSAKSKEETIELLKLLGLPLGK